MINYYLQYGVHLRTKIIENKRQFEVQKLDYPCRNLVVWIWNRNERSRNSIIRTWSYFEQVETIKGKLDIADVEVTGVWVSLSVFSLIPDLLFDCSRVLEYAKIRTVLQSSFSWDKWVFGLERDVTNSSVSKLLLSLLHGQATVVFCSTFQVPVFKQLSWWYKSVVKEDCNFSNFGTEAFLVSCYLGHRFCTRCLTGEIHSTVMTKIKWS